MTPVEVIMKNFYHQLNLVVSASIQCYLGITEGLNNGDFKDMIWKQYNKEFDEKILQDLLLVFKKYNCGVAEMAHGTLKLLQKVAIRIHEIEAREDTKREDDK